jgi:hypothetical protein
LPVQRPRAQVRGEQDRRHNEDEEQDFHVCRQPVWIRRRCGRIA